MRAKSLLTGLVAVSTGIETNRPRLAIPTPDFPFVLLEDAFAHGFRFRAA